MKKVGVGGGIGLLSSTSLKRKKIEESVILDDFLARHLSSF